MTNAQELSRRTDSITLTLNGSRVETHAANMIEFLTEQGLNPAQPGIAVALNDAVVSRSQWPEHEIQEGDRVEVITAMQGG